jgi:UDP-glucose 4-epimerase
VRFFVTILVVGGAGYVGSHAARSLRNSGYRVVLYDNLSTGFRRLAQGFELVEGDIADEAKLRPVLARVDAVMHFAAHAYVGESVENPRKYFRNNVLAALSLLNAALDTGICRFVFSSTCAVYGIPEQIPITEQAPHEPVNPYGASKLFFETRLRLTAALTETPDGTCIRDYIHVNDLADAHVRALQYLERGDEKDGGSLAINLGTGRGHSVLEVTQAVEKVTGRSVRRKMGPRGPGDRQCWWPIRPRLKQCWDGPPSAISPTSLQAPGRGYRAPRAAPKLSSGGFRAVPNR